MKLETMEYASLLAFGGVVMTFWNTLKSYFFRFSTYFVEQITISNSNIAARQAMQMYMLKNFRKSPFGGRTYSAWDMFVRPKDRRLLVAYETVEKGNVYWRGWRPIWLSTASATKSSEGPGEGGSSAGGNNGFTISFIRKTFDFEKMFGDAVEDFNARWNTPKKEASFTNFRFGINYVFGRGVDAKRGSGDESSADAPSQSKALSGSGREHWFDTSRPIRWKKEQLGEPLLPSKRPTELMILSPEVREAVDEAVFWMNSQEWYKERNIPWKRGWLLWGRPGTGKTSLARSIAQELDLPIWVFDLASLTNEELRNGWRKMSNNAPCMALIEDVDGTFHGRENVAVKGKQREGVTFDCLLNCIDGIERVNGVLVVVTTNHLDKVDQAIGTPMADGSSSRPGRIDRVIEMKEPDRAGLVCVAKRILDKRPDLWESLADEAFAKHETVCQFQEKCSQIALKARWETFKLRRLKPDFKRSVSRSPVVPQGYSGARGRGKDEMPVMDDEEVRHYTKEHGNEAIRERAVGAVRRPGREGRL